MKKAFLYLFLTLGFLSVAQTQIKLKQLETSLQAGRFVVTNSATTPIYSPYLTIDPTTGAFTWSIASSDAFVMKPFPTFTVSPAIWFGTDTQTATNYMLFNSVSLNQTILNSQNDSSDLLLDKGNGSYFMKCAGNKNNVNTASIELRNSARSNIPSGLSVFQFYYNLNQIYTWKGSVNHAYGLYIGVQQYSASAVSTLTDTFTQFNDSSASTTSSLTILRKWSFGASSNVLVQKSLVIGSTAHTPSASLDVTGDTYLATGGLIIGTKGINTTAGDAATINSPTGSFRKDNSGSAFTLTNSFITSTSVIILQVVTTGITTGYLTRPVAGAGSAVITFETNGVAGAPSANCDVNFWILN